MTAKQYEREQLQDAPSDADIADAAWFHFHGSERAADDKARSGAAAGSAAQPTNPRPRKG